MATMHGISVGHKQQQLGHTIWTEVVMRNHQYMPWVDTTSPTAVVTIYCQIRPRSEWVLGLAALYYSAEHQWKYIKCCAADDRPAVSKGYSTLNCGMHPEWSTSWPAIRYRHTSRASSGWFTYEPPWWKCSSGEARLWRKHEGVQSPTDIWPT